MKDFKIPLPWLRPILSCQVKFKSTQEVFSRGPDSLVHNIKIGNLARNNFKTPYLAASSRNEFDHLNSENDRPFFESTFGNIGQYIPYTENNTHCGICSTHFFCFEIILSLIYIMHLPFAI